eukprot:CAMPEP_0172801076 /NCGR_PEP_ID=MMETSP1075-20121228/2956_1 /TAXON_ID=2916 /ORGANISM="Ceratium fusus, Strain PA161109" /LENGTH=65 /DNA_ID=CAMNT_0013639059 /DNA_START=22 /DNA_END=219 /DNA_ORIENTATION=+
MPRDDPKDSVTSVLSLTGNIMPNLIQTVAEPEACVSTFDEKTMPSDNIFQLLRRIVDENHPLKGD